MRCILVLAAATAVSAAPAVVTWFEQDNCGSQHRTIVQLETDLCQTVPQSTTGGYRVTCNADKTGGTFTVCNRNTCDTCGVEVPFTNNQCLPNPIQYGSRSVSIDCTAANPAPPAPAAGDSLITWYEAGTCSGADRTLVLAPQELCHLVPNSQTAGYRVNCNDAGTGGVFSVCDDPNCANCNVTRPFTNQQCYDNPIQYGAASVSFQCAARGNGGGGGVPANMTGNAMAITWFEQTGCQQTDHRTVVVAPEYCHIVPGNNNSSIASYLPRCNAGRTGGVIDFCSDTRCGNCTAGPTFSNDQCLPNNPVYGSASFSATCGQITVDTVNPRKGDFLAQWFEQDSCGGTDQTLVLGGQELCHVVPNATNAGYRVTCNADGTSGTFQVCDGSTTNSVYEACSSCGVQTPFTNGDCLPNPPVFGSRSVRFFCSVPAGVTPTPSGGGGGSKSGQNGQNGASAVVASVLGGGALLGAAGLLL